MNDNLSNRMRICEEAIIEKEKTANKKLKELKLELEDVKGRLKRKEDELEGLLNRNAGMENELDDLRKDNQKLASDLMESVQERSSKNRKMSKALFVDEDVELTDDSFSSESNVEEWNARLGVLEKLMKTTCNDMRQRIEENEVAITRLSHTSTNPPPTPHPKHQQTSSLEKLNRPKTENLAMLPSDTEDMEKTESMMRENLVQMRDKVEDDGKKIQVLLEDVNEYNEEVSFITERHHELEERDQAIEIVRIHSMEPDLGGGMEERIQVMQQLQEKIRHSKEMVGMYKRVNAAEQFVNDNIAEIKEKVEENISGWNDMQQKVSLALHTS